MVAASGRRVSATRAGHPFISAPLPIMELLVWARCHWRAGFRRYSGGARRQAGLQVQNPRECNISQARLAVAAAGGASAISVEVVCSEPHQALVCALLASSPSVERNGAALG